MGLWCIGLVVYSTTIYHHDFLGEDFATYNQAWTLIGQGHLNPYDTIYHFPFFKSDFELIIWPLALVHLVYPGSVALLWIQDLAVAGSGFVVFLWIVDYLERRTVPWWPAAGVASVVLAVLVASPGAYQILSFDFHMEPISTLFVLLAGRDLWSGRHRRACDLGGDGADVWHIRRHHPGRAGHLGTLGRSGDPTPGGRGGRRRHRLVGIGLGPRRQRRIGHHHLRPPGRTADAVRPHRHRHPCLRLTPPSDSGHRPDPRPADQHVRPGQTGRCGRAGLRLGIRSPGGGDGHQRLSANTALINQAFQNAAVYPFVLLGTVMVLVWTAQRFRYGWIPAIAVALVVTVQALSYGVGMASADVRSGISQIGEAQATQIRKVLALTPADAEVISTISIMGRFCSRPYCYWFYPNGPLPVRSREVVFVFDPAAEDQIPDANAADDVGAIAFVRDRLHAHTLVNADGITALAVAATRRDDPSQCGHPS